MIKFLKPYFEHKDERGSIFGIIQEGNWKEINLIKSEKEAVRGGHYHKEMLEFFFIIDGAIELKLKYVNEPLIQSITVVKGDIFIIKPYTIHTFICLTDCVWINALDRVTEGDTYK